MHCKLELLLEVALGVRYVGEVMFPVLHCMLEAVKGVLSAGSSRSDAPRAVGAGGFVLPCSSSLPLSYVRISFHSSSFLKLSHLL